MELEIPTLEALGAWEVLEYDSETMPNVIPSTWAFKCKRFPDGLIKKFKARFCACGNMQLEELISLIHMLQWSSGLRVD